MKQLISQVSLYIRLQYRMAILLILFINIPFVLNIIYEFGIPYLLYFFLILLFALKIFVIKSNASSKKVLNKARASFRENSPSKQDIINRAIVIQNGNDYCLILSATLLLFTFIFIHP